MRFFDSAVSCEAISGSAASSVCKCCKDTVSHGRLPVFYIVQTNLVNAQGESWTVEMDDRNNLAETHRKNAGVSCFTTPRHLFTDNQSSGFCTVFRTVCSASGRPCKSSEFYSLDDPERQKGVAKRDTLSRLDKIPRGITMRNTFHFILIIAHIYLTNVCEFLLHSCRLVDILK